MRMPSLVNMAFGADLEGSFMSMVMDSPREPTPW